MPRKKVEPIPEAPLVADVADDALMARYFAVKDWLDGETKRFKLHVEPYQQEMDKIELEFLRRLNDRGSDSTKTDNGTAYKSTLLNTSVSPDGPVYRREVAGDATSAEEFKGRDALLEAALDHWESWGNEMLMINAQKDAIKRYMEEHNGSPPPGVKTNFFVRVNIRRS